MGLAKYIATRILLLLLVLFVVNMAYKLTFYESDIAKHADILENYWSVDPNCEALYFGESSNFYQTSSIVKEPKISELIDSLLPDLAIGAVDNSGLHAGIYLAVIKNIPEDSPVHTLIITMNLRSFGPTWRYAIGENYLAKTEVMLASRPSALNKFLVSLKEYDYKTDAERKNQMLEAYKTEKITLPNFKYDNIHEWDSAMAWGEWKAGNPNLTLSNLPLAASYIKNYAFTIDPFSNERIKDFDEIMDLANRRGLKVIFNILDYNHEEGEKLVGIELTQLMDDKRVFLKNRYSLKGALVVDNLFTISDTCFTDRAWPTEHYSLEGKKAIALKVSGEIKTSGWLN